MHIILQTPLEIQTFDALWIEFNTSLGNFVIEAGHAPMILNLSEGKPLIIGCTNNISISRIVSGGALAHITLANVTILAEGLIS